MMFGKKNNSSISVNEVTASTKRRYLEVRDLVFLGICFILYAVIMIVLIHLAVLSTPWAYPLLPALIATVEVFVYLLLIRRAPVPGVVFIFTLLLIALLMISGHGALLVIVGLVCGALADVIVSQNPGRWLNQLVSYVVFSLWALSTNLLFYLSVDAFSKDVGLQRMGSEFIRNVQQAVSFWHLSWVISITALAAVIGAYWGHFILKKVWL